MRSSSWSLTLAPLALTSGLGCGADPSPAPGDGTGIDPTATTTGLTSTGASTDDLDDTTGDCPGALLSCTAGCVDPQSDAEHCGACDTPCAPEASCQAGTCVASCDAPEVGCDGTCHDLSNDEQHCGACDMPCPAGQPCVEGQCVAVSLHHVLITGQSLSVGALSEVVSTEQPFENVSFVTGVRAGGAGLDSLVPLVETSDGSQGETLASGMANLLTERALGAGGDHRSLMSAHGVGGQPYSALAQGTAAYANGMAQVAAGLAAAQGEGEAYAVRAVVVIHGETDHINGNAGYDLDLLQWQGDYEADIQAMTGQTLSVPLITDQMSSFSALGSEMSAIAQLQLEASRAEPERIVLMGPKYVLPYVPDGVHLSGDGERWLGEMHAKVFEHVLVQGQPWRPVSPRAITRDGAEIDVQMWVPVPPLVLDDVQVSDPGSYGFGFSDGSGAPPSIVSVEVVGEDSVRITLSDVPVGDDQRLRYAMNGIVGQPGGPTTGARGNLRDSDSTASRHGYSLFNWCVHFDEPVE